MDISHTAPRAATVGNQERAAQREERRSQREAERAARRAERAQRPSVSKSAEAEMVTVTDANGKRWFRMDPNTVTGQIWVGNRRVQ
ncbi:hypothetical protein [Crossiella sp. CA198]|uniref:hypothetical protein n=1 Tax=Crossiella sp. CA198 TaxID=3455607 RepID=UPI003F8CFDD6